MQGGAAVISMVMLSKPRQGCVLWSYSDALGSITQTPTPTAAMPWHVSSTTSMCLFRTFCIFTFFYTLSEMFEKADIFKHTSALLMEMLTSSN